MTTTLSITIQYTTPKTLQQLGQLEVLLQQYAQTLIHDWEAQERDLVHNAEQPINAYRQKRHMTTYRMDDTGARRRKRNHEQRHG